MIPRFAVVRARNVLPLVLVIVTGLFLGWWWLRPALNEANPQSLISIALADAEEDTAWFERRQTEAVDAFLKGGNVTILFLHLYKAGGTSFAHILTRLLKISPSRMIDISRYRNFSCWEPSGQWFSQYGITLENYTLIRGHYGFGVHESLPPGRKYVYLTMLRHPVSRVLSGYFYKKTQSYERVNITNATLDEFLSWDFYENDNFMVRTYCGLSAYYYRYGQLSRAHLQCAKRNLRLYFSVVGIMEQYNETIELLARTFRRTSAIHVHTNRIKEGSDLYEQKQRAANDPNIIQRIAQMNALDIELYHYAERLFEVQLASLRRRDGVLVYDTPVPATTISIIYANPHLRTDTSNPPRRLSLTYERQYENSEVTRRRIKILYWLTAIMAVVGFGSILWLVRKLR